MAESQYGYISDKTRYLDRLKRIEGQARGIHRKIEEEQYCIDILTQIWLLPPQGWDIRLTLVGTDIAHEMEAQYFARAQMTSNERALTKERP